LIEIKAETAGIAGIEGKAGAITGGNPPLSLSLKNLSTNEVVDISNTLKQRW